RGAVPRERDAREDEPSDQRAADDAEPGAIEPAVRRQPVDREEERNDRRNGADRDQERDPEPAPAAPRREAARRPDGLDGEHGEVRERNEKTDEIDGTHGALLGCGAAAVTPSPYDVSQNA